MNNLHIVLDATDDPFLLTLTLESLQKHSSCSPKSLHVISINQSAQESVHSLWPDASCECQFELTISAAIRNVQRDESSGFVLVLPPGSIQRLSLEFMFNEDSGLPSIADEAVAGSPYLMHLASAQEDHEAYLLGNSIHSQEPPPICTSRLTLTAADVMNWKPIEFLNSSPFTVVGGVDDHLLLREMARDPRTIADRNERRIPVHCHWSTVGEDIDPKRLLEVLADFRLQTYETISLEIRSTDPQVQALASNAADVTVVGEDSERIPDGWYLKWPSNARVHPCALARMVQEVQGTLERSAILKESLAINPETQQLAVLTGREVLLLQGTSDDIPSVMTGVPELLQMRTSEEDQDLDAITQMEMRAIALRTAIQRNTAETEAEIALNLMAADSNKNHPPSSVAIAVIVTASIMFVIFLAVLVTVMVYYSRWAEIPPVRVFSTVSSV